VNEVLSANPTDWAVYLWLAFGIPLAVRIFISLIEAARLRTCPLKIFGGFSSDNEIPSDYWLAYVLGMIEMLAYPVFFASSFVAPVGAWLLFKTVHRWHYAPDTSRGPYNRYLVANAAVLLGSYFSARFAFSVA